MTASGGATVVVAGMVAGAPHQGGATWAVLQYVLGLRALGYDVHLIDPVTVPPGATLEALSSATYFADVVRAFGLEGRAALLHEATHATIGPAYDTLVEVAGRADVLLNISGMLTAPDLVQPVPTRVWLDLDPAFNQLWHAQGIDMRMDVHNRFVTVGQNLGDPSCPVPTLGRDWIHTLPPVLLDHWPVADRVVTDALTTVGNWRGYGSIQHEGVHYGQKAHSLRPLMELPARTGARFAPALSIHPDETDDLARLRANGWDLRDPRRVAATPETYGAFVRGSLAELGIAKSGYVASRCGWFSDRSAVYLASGRPVIAQDTGFAPAVPVGEGLLPFTTGEDVVAAIDHLRSDYRRHARAAREIAEQVLDSRRVLPRLLDLVTIADAA